MKLHLGYFLGLFAIALAASAGYISVVGWGKLFAGEATIVMIIMGIIESAKIITTIYLHRYGKRKPRPEGVNIVSYFFKGLLSLKTYLIVGVISTMILTSVGIYGFLTGAYQDTANKLEIHDSEVSILIGKKEIFEVKISDNKSIINSKTDRINTLSNLREQQEVRLDSLLNKHHWSNAKKTQIQIEEANTEIQNLNNDIDEIVIKNSLLQDSVSHYQVKVLESKSNSDVAVEIGPLKYVSTLTGKPMDSIINWIVLIIIFIFDPMAISLVLASNKVFDENKRVPLVTPNLKDVPKTPEKKEKNNQHGITPELTSTQTSPPTSVITPSDNNVFEPEPDGITNDNVEDVVNDVVGNPEDIAKGNRENFSKINKNIKPVVTTGSVKREEIKEIKNGNRGYSMDIPTNEKTRVGTNKVVKGGVDNKFYFNRPS